MTVAIICAAAAAFAAAGILFLHTTPFGALPKGARLKRIQASPHCREGRFQNTLAAPRIQKSGMGGVLKMQWHNRGKRRPSFPLPTVQTDLAALPGDAIVWFGHFSFFLQISGIRILVDPVFSRAASPVPFVNIAFPYTYTYTAADFPEADCILITHDHWDHLDYPTIRALHTRAIICPLGVGAHLARFGVPPDIVHETDWGDSTPIGPLAIHTLEAQHYSGRSLQSNRTLWASYLIETAGMRIFISGDTGYGPHFKSIGRQFGPVDLAVLENGQYNPAWHHIHMLPEETAQAALDLGAKAVLPAHSCKFSLSAHAWYEPLQALSEEAAKKSVTLMTPQIGQPVFPKEAQAFTHWWVPYMPHLSNR